MIVIEKYNRIMVELPYISVKTDRDQEGISNPEIFLGAFADVGYI